MEFTPHAKRAFHLQSYGLAPSIDGVELVELKRFADDGGTLTELARLSDGRTAAVAGFTLRQINYSELAAGAIKAFHLHTRQTDVWYVPPGDRLLVVLVDVRQGSKTEGVRVRLVLRSEEHTSELQSRLHLVCRLLLEKKKKEKAIALTPRYA